MTKLEHSLGILKAYRNFWLRFADYLELLPKGGQHRLRTRGGLTLAVRGCTSDMPIADELFVRRTYDLALELLRPGSQVIDIGAQSGIFSIAAAARGAKVFCYEPFPPNTSQIRRNAELNGFIDRITVNEFAVGAKAGKAELLYKDHDTGGSTLYRSIHREWHEDPMVKKTTVNVVTLADIFRTSEIDHCDCLKLDCEGAEYDILLSRPAELARVGAIILEYHPNGDVRELRKTLEAAGFAVQMANDSCTLFASREPGRTTICGALKPTRIRKLRRSVLSTYRLLSRSMSGYRLTRLGPVAAVKKAVAGYLSWGLEPGIFPVNGYRMYLPAGELGLALSGFTERQVTDYIRSIVKPGMVALDVGAHIGYYTVMLAGLVGSSGRLFAFEPEPDNREILERNLH